MMKRLIVPALIVLPMLAVTAWAAGPSAQASTNAAAACKAQRAQIGETAFAQAWGTLGRCVTSLARVEQQNLDAARAACTAEQSDPNFAATHEGKTFAQFYGSGPSGKNAFASCVSAKSKASSKAEGQARPNPARLCRAERTAMTPAVFTQTYGGTANAFGKCVSAKARAQNQNEVAAASTCRTEMADAAAFAQAYGTGANAFGKCVSTKAKARTTEQQQATIKAAKACAAEQKASPAAFKAKYGTFGRCVSQQRTAD